MPADVVHLSSPEVRLEYSQDMMELDFSAHRLKTLSHHVKDPSTVLFFLPPGETVTESAARSGNDSKARYFLPDGTVSLRETSGS